MGEPRFARLILAVRDLAAMTSFYRDVLRWVTVVDASVYVELQDPGGMQLGLYADRNFGLNLGTMPDAHLGLTRTEIYLQCADPEAVLERAIAAGAQPLSPLGPRDWGDEAAYVADPEGNIVVFARPLRVSASGGGTEA